MSAGSGRVLVVDDDRTSRRKLALALKQLGHGSIEASGGDEALELLGRTDVDLILLDIVMPEMDGYEVLRRLKAGPKFRHIPVLVISGLDDDKAAIAAAIELGAEDFLPKTFDPILFRARVNACLEKRRLRNVELDHLEQVDKLTAAAELMENGRFHPKDLELDAVAARPDAIGRLAGVFLEMAEQVYERERRLQGHIRRWKGIVLLLAVGVIDGLELPIAVMLYGEIPKPLGVAFWVNLLAGLLCLGWCASRGTLRPPPRPALGFILVWAVLQGASSIMIFQAGGHISGITLSIIAALQGFLVFLIAAVMRIEAPSLRRLAGLGCGMAGLLVMLLARSVASDTDERFWTLAAFSIPLLIGLMDLLLATRRPTVIEPMLALGLMLVVATAMIGIVAATAGQLFVLRPDIGAGAGLILLRACLSVCAFVLYMRLIAVAGAVFGSQTAYVTTLAGIGWSILLLGEMLSFDTAGALALVLVGLLLVGPKVDAGAVQVEFRRRVRR